MTQKNYHKKFLLDPVPTQVKPSDTVLELGGRYATTSCAIAARLANSGRLVVVEPDPSVWAVHEFNKLSHNCKSFSVFGVLGDEDAVVQGLAYNTRTRPVGEGGMLVKHFTWSQLEATTGLKVEQFLKQVNRLTSSSIFQIDTLVMDCEGCWVDVVLNNRDKMDRVKTILLGKL